MSGPDFLFSFYGLLLGLALTEVISGFSRALDQRSSHPIGWFTPLLAVVLALDLLTFYAGAWVTFRDIEFATRLLVTTSIAPIIYYFSATQLFPREGETYSSLDGHFFDHRKWVIGGVILANLVDVGPVIWGMVQTTGLDTSIGLSLVGNGAYLIGLAAVSFLHSRWLILSILIAEILWLLSIIWILL